MFTKQENFKISDGQGLKEKEEEEAKIAEHVKAMVNYLYSLRDKRVEVNEKIFAIAKELEEKYPDLRQTYLFHVMSHSNVTQEDYTYFDLPGEDSIVKRLEALVKEYQTNK